MVARMEKGAILLTSADTAHVVRSDILDFANETVTVQYRDLLLNRETAKMDTVILISYYTNGGA